MEEKCGNCKWFVRDFPDGITGECFHDPPVLVQWLSGEKFWERPPVTDTEFCHNFALKEAE